MKDYTRDYSTEAFRFYAQNGKSADKYKEKIYNEALEHMKKKEGNRGGFSSPTEAAIIRAENAVDQKMAEIRDMEAVEMTLRELEAIRRFEIIRAIEIVYFADSNEELRKGEIQDRVHQAEINIPASERSIYYYLKKARKLFAMKRGLRI